MPKKTPIAGLLALLALAAPGAAGAQDPERFSLSMFHFNVQYVAGGLLGFPDGFTHLPDFELDERTVEDLIITESFAPALDLLEAHPTWKLTLELQGYMVEVMLERHPEVVDALRALVDEGRVELVSFHYSDQLFLAYPRVDMERSRELLDDVMARAGLTLSPVTFCQEGQFGEGMATFGPEHGQTILGLPKNLFRYQHAALEASAAPLYRLGDADVVLIGRGFETDDVSVTWSYFDDGELWSTNDGSPYLGRAFVLNPESVAEYEQAVAAQEAAGARIATIQEYVDWVKSHGIEQPALPPILDGTWQPASTDSMYRWMGKAGVVDALYQCERDNEVVTTNVRTSHDLVTAETLLGWARAEGLVGAAEVPDDLRACWQPALLGQVTDASGINPFVGEIEYGLGHAAEARACAAALTNDVAARVGSPYLVVDNEARTVTPARHAPRETARTEAPLFTEADGFTVDAPGRVVEVTWEALGDSGRLHRVTITAGLPASRERTIAVTFPFALDELRVSPGLVEDEVRTYPLGGFDFEEGGISLPIANGLIGIDDDRWLLQDTSRVHVAVTIRAGEPTLLLRDSTMDPEAEATWVFYVLEGTADEALAEANHRNVRPTITVAGPPSFAVQGGGCGCRTAGAPGDGGATTALLGLGLALSVAACRRGARRAARAAAGGRRPRGR